MDSQKIQWILFDVIVLVASVAFHEFGHAVMAYKLGDDTPKRQGRVTLNPLAHADPIGTLLLPLLGGIYSAAGGGLGGFGWGRPVQWNASRINRKYKMSTARILVAVAGPAMNVFLAIVIAGIHTVLVKTNVVQMWDSTGHVTLATRVLMFAVGTNFILFFFNLVPAPPLDGGHVAGEMMPYKHRKAYDAYARFGPFIVMAVALIPQLAQIFVVPAKFCTLHVYQLFGLL